MRRTILVHCAVCWFALGSALAVDAAPVSHASLIIDAGSGAVLHSSNAGHPWHPASLTKVMTLYLTFQALQRGELHWDEVLTTSRYAASMPEARLGLQRGETLTVKQAVLAVATRSANDAAVVLAERLAGSEAAFAARMTQQARALGMTGTVFRNANGLTHPQQVTTARDMALLARALIRHFPREYALFSERQWHYKGRPQTNINGILYAYPGADGIKTGFTCGAGYNLIASAQRQGRRLIAVLLGETSRPARTQHMIRLLDHGFKNHGFKAGAPRSDGLEDIAILNVAAPQRLNSEQCGSGPRVYVGDRSPRVAATFPVGDWAVVLGAYIAQRDAAERMQQISRYLGASPQWGQPVLIRRLLEGEMHWHVLYTGLSEKKAGELCKTLWAQDLDCTVLFPEQLKDPDAQWR